MTLFLVLQRQLECVSGKSFSAATKEATAEGSSFLAACACLRYLLISLFNVLLSISFDGIGGILNDFESENNALSVQKISSY